MRLRPSRTFGGRAGPVSRQAESIYGQLRSILAPEGAAPEHVVQETVFFQNILRDFSEFMEARSRVFGGSKSRYAPATVTIEEPPLEPLEDSQTPLEAVFRDSENFGLGGGEGLGSGEVRVEAVFRVVIPQPGVPSKTWLVPGAPACSCPACEDVSAKVLQLGGTRHTFAGNIYGAPGKAFDEALSMFEVADGILKALGLDFRSVVRTWIYLRDMERDYAEFNRARRTFFRRVGLEVLPASTGINGGPFPPDHNYVFGFYALEDSGSVRKTVMTTPTLNEAPEYGSDFSRGLAVSDGNKRALYVSGTASVDELGRTAHEEDFVAQVRRMLLNIEKLLEGQRATLADMVSAVTYLKHASDAPVFQRICRERGIGVFPHAIVQADVCRPELLCEMEGIAIPPAP